MLRLGQSRPDENAIHEMLGLGRRLLRQCQQFLGQIADCGHQFAVLHARLTIPSTTPAVLSALQCLRPYTLARRVRLHPCVARAAVLENERHSAHWSESTESRGASARQPAD